MPYIHEDEDIDIHHVEQETEFLNAPLPLQTKINVNIGPPTALIDPNISQAFADLLKANSGGVEEHWMRAHWRPAAAWIYLFICFCDFFAFPIGWSILQAHYSGTVQAQWNPITLQGAGLFHLAMGAIIGISAWGRTKEKVSLDTATKE